MIASVSVPEFGEKGPLRGTHGTPGQIFEAGEVQLALVASDDVVEADILYGDTFVATLPIAAFPYTFDITSRNMCDGTRTFTAIVRDSRLRRQEVVVGDESWFHDQQGAA